MKTIKFHVKGKLKLTKEFYESVWHAQYLDPKTKELTVKKLAEEPLTFKSSCFKEADIVVLVYDGREKDTWDAIVPEMKKKDPRTVIASWRESKLLDVVGGTGNAQLVSFSARDCEFVDDRLLSCPHHSLVLAEDLWDCFQDVAERKVGRKLPSLREHLSGAYWGEEPGL